MYKLILFLLLLLPKISLATPTITSPFGGESGINSIGQLLEVIVNAVTTIAIPIIVLAFIWVGFKFVYAQGDSTKISEAKNALWLTLGGTAIILGSNVLLEVVVETTEDLMGQ